jgi:SAM-dependent methyltransferase
MGAMPAYQAAESGPTPGDFSAEAWADLWREARDSSPLKASQISRPGRWGDFYSQVGAAWLHAWGEPWVLGRRVSEFLARQGLLEPGRTVLDLGCGPGSLAVPLAEAGAWVVGLDAAPGMIRALRAEASRRGLANLEAHCQCWTQAGSLPRHDLVLAAFFPEALEPQGLGRMEELSRGSCALVLASGEEPFVFRRELWRRVMGPGQGRSDMHLVCALGYLLATGRRPHLAHLAWPGRYDRPLEEVVEYYKHYFGLFGHDGQDTDEAIRATLAPYVENNRVKAQGRVEVGVIWWGRP